MMLKYGVICTSVLIVLFHTDTGHCTRDIWSSDYEWSPVNKAAPKKRQAQQILEALLNLDNQYQSPPPKNNSPKQNEFSIYELVTERGQSQSSFNFKEPQSNNNPLPLIIVENVENSQFGNRPPGNDGLSYNYAEGKHWRQILSDNEQHLSQDYYYCAPSSSKYPHDSQCLSQTASLTGPQYSSPPSPPSLPHGYQYPPSSLPHDQHPPPPPPHVHHPPPPPPHGHHNLPPPPPYYDHHPPPPPPHGHHHPPPPPPQEHHPPPPPLHGHHYPPPPPPHGSHHPPSPPPHDHYPPPLPPHGSHHPPPPPPHDHHSPPPPSHEHHPPPPPSHGHDHPPPPPPQEHHPPPPPLHGHHYPPPPRPHDNHSPPTSQHAHHYSLLPSHNHYSRPLPEGPLHHNPPPSSPPYEYNYSSPRSPTDHHQAHGETPSTQLPPTSSNLPGKNDFGPYTDNINTSLPLFRDNRDPETVKQKNNIDSLRESEEDWKIDERFAQYDLAPTPSDNVVVYESHHGDQFQAIPVTPEV